MAVFALSLHRAKGPGQEVPHCGSQAMAPRMCVVALAHAHWCRLANEPSAAVGHRRAPRYHPPVTAMQCCGVMPLPSCCLLVRRLALNMLDSPSMRVPLTAVWGRSGISRNSCGRRGFGQGQFMLIMVTAASFLLPEATLRMWLSIPPLGMPLTAPTSGWRGLSLPGLALLMAWG